MSNNPYQSTQFPGGPNKLGGGEASRKVTPPAIALIVVGVINLLLSIWNLISSLITDAAAQKAQLIAQWQQAGMSAEQIEVLSGIMDAMTGPVGLALVGIQLLVGAFIIYGALNMKNLNSYGMAMAASIIAMVPCVSACCLIGLPLGIWAIVVLNQKEVKSAFV